jgi:thioredoxin-dependent peroxiredoxin
MPAIAVGQSAPSFRLPSAQGVEIGLEDLRGKKNVIVWFTKGMACPFCRAQMSQLSRAYGELQKLDAEILEVSVSGVARAQAYARKFRLPFPYLCDPDYQVRRAWGLEPRSHGLGHYVRGYIQGAMAEKPANDFGHFLPPLDETRNLLNDDDMGFVIVDKRGVVRYSLAGSYMEGSKTRSLPSNDEILREIRKCETPWSDALDASGSVP